MEVGSRGDRGVRTGRRRARSPSGARLDVQLRWAADDRSTTAGGDEPALDTSRDDERSRPVMVERSLVGDARAAAGNLLICADALDATNWMAADSRLEAVSLCYIDPPFNRGEDFAHYNDALPTGAWLSMLRDRLRGVRDVLRPDGSVWLHLDDAAQHHGRCLLDEVFGPDAFVATVIWQRRTSRDNRTAFSAAHDYIHVYAPAGARSWRRRRNALPDKGRFSNPDDDPRGPWRSAPMSAQAGHATASQFYAVVSPSGHVHEPPSGRCWTYTRERLDQLVADGRVYWPRGGRGKPRLKRYADEVEGLAPSTLWMADEVGENAHAKKDMLALFADRSAFDTPKPESLLERVVQVATRPGEVVLDCFAGSGTTLAVAHKLGRRWVGVERSNHVFETFTLPRLTMVVQGDDAVGISERLRWQGGGGFRVLQAVPEADWSGARPLSA